MRLTTSSLVRLYPRTWRQRYGDEMRAVLEVATIRQADRVDLVRGALDAWLHPPTPSVVPAAAALVGGGAWTIGAAAVIAQPTPADWPGYVIDVIGLALVAVALLLVATLGCALRRGDGGGNAERVAVAVTLVGYLAWMAALTATAAGHAEGAMLAAAQTLAMAGTLLVGLLLLRSGDQRVGMFVVVGPAAMLVPWTVAWLAFGAAWTAVGVSLMAERSGWTGEPPRLT